MSTYKHLSRSKRMQAYGGKQRPTSNTSGTTGTLYDPVQITRRVEGYRQMTLFEEAPPTRKGPSKKKLTTTQLRLCLNRKQAETHRKKRGPSSSTKSLQIGVHSITCDTAFRELTWFRTAPLKGTVASCRSKALCRSVVTSTMASSHTYVSRTFAQNGQNTPHGVWAGGWGGGIEQRGGCPPERGDTTRTYALMQGIRGGGGAGAQGAS